MEGTSEFINQLNCFHGDSFHVYHWGEGPILPKLVSDSCGARGTEAPGKVAEEEWRWVAIFSLHSNSRPGREHNRDGREGSEGGGGGWVSLPSYNVGGLWTATTHS